MTRWAILAAAGISLLLSANPRADAVEGDQALVGAAGGLRPLHSEFTADTLQAAAGNAKDPKLSSHLLGLIRADEQARLRGSAITAGSTGMLPEDLRAAVDSRLMRLDDQDEFVVAINFSNRPISGSVTVDHAAEFKLLKFAGMPEPSGSGLPNLKLNGFEWRIYHRSVL